MGGHYGSIQFRTVDRNAVRVAADAVARERSIRCLVGPTREGWTGVYPQDNGQDDAVGAALAARVAGHAIHLLVHDDDVLAYWLYADGALVDRYWSAPGYFGDEHRAEEEAFAGEVDRFAFVLDETGRDKLRGALDRDADVAFESERLARVATILGIANAVTAYEYLKDGENDGVRGRKRFVEVPGDAVESERAKRAAERKRIAAEWKRSARSGLLLARDERKAGQAFGVAIDDGFVVAWSDVRMQSASVLERYAPPWGATTPMPSVALPERLHVTDFAAAGARLAIPTGDRVRIFDRDASGTWTPTFEIPEPDLTLAVSLSANGSRVAHASRNGIVVADVASGRLLITTPPPQNHCVTALSPDGTRLLVGGLSLRIVDVDGGRSRELFVGGIVATPVVAAMLAQFAKLTDAEIDAAIAKQTAAAAKMLASMEKKLPAEQFAMMREQFAKMADVTRERMTKLQRGTLPPVPRRALEAAYSAGWTSDGRWLWCGTDKGLRVFDAATIEALPDGATPTAVWSAPLPDPPANPFGGGVVDAVESRGGLIFAGRGQSIGRLDLATGDVRTIVRFPMPTTVIGLACTADGARLGVSTFDQGDRLQFRSSWQVWDLDAPNEAEIADSFNQ